MDWPSRHDPFLLPHCKNTFACGFKAKNKLHCTVLQVYDTDGWKRVEKFVLKTPERWDDWFTNCGIFSEEDAPIPLSDLPRRGACIFFIPRTEDVELPENDPIEADLTDLPIPQEKWEKIAKAFHLLPSHIVKAIAGKATFITSIPQSIHDDGGVGGLVWPLWMQIATTSTQGPDTFALASTHIDRSHLTLAVMIGCSVKQINRVRSLLEGAELAITHPLLMLGICAELQLDRLKNLVEDKVTECLETTRLLEATRREVDPSQDTHRFKGEITWGLINKVRACRDGSKRAEEEVNATKRQLAKALPPDFVSSVERTENHESNDSNSKKRRGSIHSDINAPSASTSEPDFDKEDEPPTNFTAMFSERFADIFAQFEGLVAECRISVEEMSFAADIIRSELARQEAKSSGQEAKMSTVIAFVAMLYLPMTTVATIFAMPVFQFPNDWKNWRYQSVNTGGSSSSNSTTANSPDLPVFSGYFWIYAGISIAFTLFTIEGWWRFTSREIERRRGIHWSRYLWGKTYRHIKRRIEKLHLAGSLAPHQQPTQPAQQALPAEDEESDTESESESESEKSASGSPPQTASASLALLLPKQNLSTMHPPPLAQTIKASEMPPNPSGASSLASQAPTPRSGSAYNTQPASLSTSGEQTAVNTATTSKSSTGSGGGPFRDLPQVVAAAVAATAAGDPAVLRGDKARRSTSAFDMV